MARKLSPIERMIDEACGLKPWELPAPIDAVTLRCPKCKKQLRVPRESHDPARAETVEAKCLECAGSGEWEEVVYFDAVGNQVFMEDEDDPE